MLPMTSATAIQKPISRGCDGVFTSESYRSYSWKREAGSWTRTAESIRDRAACRDRWRCVQGARLGQMR